MKKQTMSKKLSWRKDLEQHLHFFGLPNLAFSHIKVWADQPNEAGYYPVTIYQTAYVDGRKINIEVDTKVIPCDEFNTTTKNTNLSLHFQHNPKAVHKGSTHLKTIRLITDKRVMSQVSNKWLRLVLEGSNGIIHTNAVFGVMKWFEDNPQLKRQATICDDGLPF